MQVCFFSVSGVLPHDEANGAIKDSIRQRYGKKGEEIVRMNLAAVGNTLAHLFEVTIPGSVNSRVRLRHPVPDEAPRFVRDVLGPLIAGRGNGLPVSRTSYRLGRRRIAVSLCGTNFNREPRLLMPRHGCQQNCQQRGSGRVVASSGRSRSSNSVRTVQNVLKPDAAERIRPLACSLIIPPSGYCCGSVSGFPPFPPLEFADSRDRQFSLLPNEEGV